MVDEKRSKSISNGIRKRQAWIRAQLIRAQKLTLLTVVLGALIVLLVGIVIWQGNMVTKGNYGIVRLEKRLDNIEFVAGNFMLYEKIEDILKEEAEEKMTTAEVIDTTRVIFRFQQRYGETIGLTAERILAVIDKESVFDPKAKSPAGAIGLVQVMPYNFSSLLEECYGLEGLTKEKRHALMKQPDINLTCGLTYLLELQIGYLSENTASKDDWKMAHTRYCWSHESVKMLAESMSKKEPKASLNYANDIKQLMQKYKEKLYEKN